MEEEVIEINDQFYILAPDSRVDDRSRVLKDGDTFIVLDHYGDIQPLGLAEEGLYHEGTRFLNRFCLTLNGRQPLLLSSMVLEDNSLLSVDLTNLDVTAGEQIVLRRESLHLFRACFLHNAACYMKLRVRNYAPHEAQLALRMAIGCDFADIFEVRGTKREARGTQEEPEVEPDKVMFRYRGLDHQTRETVVTFSPTPDRLNASAAWYEWHLAANEERTCYVTIACDAAGRAGLMDFERARGEQQQRKATSRASDVQVTTNNPLFDDWIGRSEADIHMMITQTDYGPYPYAGVPWYSTVFGRDGIITALEFLWMKPELARGVLTYLAAYQADEVDTERDAEPGKILHERRSGEMAALNEIPFGKYYGSVDATPLFVMLAGAYYERTADRAFIARLWPHIERAIAWIDTFGDIDNDGFCEYFRHSAHGLISQGWKDSFDAVFHDDGALAEAPLALAEVQGYVFAARLAAARMADTLGHDRRAAELRASADRLQEEFDRAFWCDDLGTYALALDRDKRPCRVRASNAGQCLFSGIAKPERAAVVAQTLLSEASHSGWGIRTVSTCAARYNPMAYHNGSVWPHDNALIAYGFARYGLQREAASMLEGLFEASSYFDLHRMPELFCGFPRRNGEGPTLYPVACAPQSWAAGAVFYMLQACLGLSLDAERKQIRFVNPTLPSSLNKLWIKQLRLGDSTTDLVLERYSEDVGVQVESKQGDVEIVAVK